MAHVGRGRQARSKLLRLIVSRWPSLEIFSRVHESFLPVGGTYGAKCEDRFALDGEGRSR